MDYQGQFTFIKGEAKNLKFTWLRNGSPVNMQNTVCRAVAKRNLNDTSYIFEKTDSSFNKDGAADGVIILSLSKDDTMVAPFHENTTLLLQLEVSFLDEGEVDKTWIYKLNLRATVFHD